MNDSVELTLLRADQLFFDLKVIKKYGLQAVLTDLAIVTGGDFFSQEHRHIDNLSKRIGRYWTSSSKDGNVVRILEDIWLKTFSYKRYSRTCCIRPSFCSNTILTTFQDRIKRKINGVEEIDYGEYPQMAVGAGMQNILEHEYTKETLVKTGKCYTFDSAAFYSYEQEFQPVKYDEYYYKGKKYIRVKVNSSDEVLLSNRREYVDGDFVWIKVSPIRWLVDRETDTFISKKLLLAGIRFHEKETFYQGHFEKSEMKKYLDTYMAKEIMPSTNLIVDKIKEEIEEEIREETKAQKDEVTHLISKIDRLMEPLNEQRKQEFKNKVNQLLENYNRNHELIKPTFSFMNEPSLIQEDSFQSLKEKLIAQLEAMIQSLYENDNLLSLLDGINHYQTLLSLEKLDIPSSTENMEDKIIYVIAVSMICHEAKIIEQLDDLFKQVTTKISIILSQSCEQEISLTLENQINVQNLFKQMIETIFTTVQRYYTIQMTLRGIGEDELSKEIQQLYQLLTTLDEELQKKYDLEFVKLREEISFDVCVNSDIEKIMTTIESKLEPLTRKIRFQAAIKETLNEIKKLLEDPNLPLYLLKFKENNN